MMKVFGLTGSIGMGKSTAAQMLRDMGIPVQDSDQTVHIILSENKDVIALINDAFPGVKSGNIIDRQKLGARVFENSAALHRLEEIIHPRVAACREDFLLKCRQSKAQLAVLEIPLLYETGGEALCDKVILLTAPAEIQRDRVLSRPGMTVDKFEGILKRQMTDAEKRQRADYIIDSSQGRQSVLEKLQEIVNSFALENNRAKN